MSDLLCAHSKIGYISYLSAKMNYLKSAVTPVFKPAPSIYESDLSNEILCSIVPQRAAKLMEVKVGDLEKIVLHIKVDSKKWGPGLNKTISFSNLQL